VLYGGPKDCGDAGYGGLRMSTRIINHHWLRPRAMTDGVTIMANADIAMAPTHAFQALNTSEVERWWGSADTYRMTQWQSDIRVGGRWHVVVLTVDGNAFLAGGEFLEIDAPNKIVKTRKYEWDHPTLGSSETRVTYLFEQSAIGTRLTVRHDGFAGRQSAAQEHAEGWERVLSWLSVYARAGRYVDL